MALLDLHHITKDFPGVRALDGVSFDLKIRGVQSPCVSGPEVRGAGTAEKGEIHALCGENGAGKSTLIKVLCGYFPAGTYGGEIHLDGTPIHFRSLRDAEHHGIALIAQELALVPELSIAENLALGREPLRRGLIDWQEVYEGARRALERVGLDVDPRRPVKELGIGQQQMVEIAKALAKNAAILVLDEPTAALTESDADRLLALLDDLRGRGVSSIYISHRLQEVFRIADRITVLRDGRSVGTDPARSLTTDGVIARMVGREVTSLYPRGATSTGPALLSVKGWSVADPTNPGRYVVRDVSFDVRAGEVVGIAGLMGAGRTALVSSLFGAARSKVEGQMRLGDGGERGPFLSPSEAIAHGVALVSEDRKRYGLVLEASVGENLTLVTLRRFVRAGLIDHRAREREADGQAASLRLKTTGLDAPVNQLSGGNQQKVVLGKWLLARPRILFLDEPTRGIDVGAKAEIYQLISQLATQGIGVVLVSSELPEVLGLSHRVLVLSLGRQTALLGAAEASAERVMSAATAMA